MKRQPSLIVNRDLKRLLHKLLARQSNLRVQRGGKHLHLLLVRRHLEYRLNVAAHVEGVEHFVAFVENEVFHIRGVQMLATDQS